MKITFIEPSFSEVHADDTIFPFGYACLGGVLQRAGHEVKYVFPSAERLNMKEVLDRIAKSDTDIIGIGGLLPYLSTVIKFVKMIKSVRNNIPVVLGGPMVTYFPELVLKKTGADFCIAGEGEIALLKFVNCLQKKEDYSDIAGLVFQKDDKIINNGMGEIMAFEDIPMPNWDDFPMEYYLYSDWFLPKWSRTKKERVFAWILSRGCPMKCNFCASGCEPRYKTLEQSITELHEIVNKFDPDYLLFTDNFLMRNKKYTIEFCEALITNGFRFKFSITGRVDIVDPQMLMLMKRAGCQMIFYGLECANNDILKFMKKGITVEQTVRAIEMTKKAGIYPMVSIMFGQPGETFEDFFNSLQISLMTTDANDPGPNIASVMPLLTFPGTSIYNYAKENGHFVNNKDYWEKYGDNFRIRYTDFSDEIVNQITDIANTMSRWKYHQSMADNLLESLRRRRSPYVKLRHYIKQFLKSHNKITKIFSHFLGDKKLNAIAQAEETSHQKRVYKFVDRCLDEIIGLNKK